MGLRGGKETRSYGKPASEVFEAIEQTLAELKMTLAEKTEDTIKAKTGINFLSVGLKIAIHVEPVNEQETAVAIQAAPKGVTLVDYGRGSGEIRRIFQGVEQKLGMEPIPEKACPSCGKEVQPQDKFCEHCGADTQQSG